MLKVLLCVGQPNFGAVQDVNREILELFQRRSRLFHLIKVKQKFKVSNSETLL